MLCLVMYICVMCWTLLLSIFRQLPVKMSHLWAGRACLWSTDETYACVNVHQRSLTHRPSSQGWAFRCPVIVCLFVSLICRYVAMFGMWVGVSFVLLFLNILV